MVYTVRSLGRKSGYSGLLLSRNIVHETYTENPEFEKSVANDIANTISTGWNPLWGEADLYFTTNGNAFANSDRIIAVVLHTNKMRSAKAALNYVIKKIDKKRGGHFRGRPHEHVYPRDFIPLIENYETQIPLEFPGSVELTRMKNTGVVNSYYGNIYTAKINSQKPPKPKKQLKFDFETNSPSSN